MCIRDRHYVKAGNAKEMVDIYKKILVNQYDENETENGGEKKSEMCIRDRGETISSGEYQN